MGGGEHACVCPEVSGGHQVAFPMTLYLNPLRQVSLTEPGAYCG